MQPINLLDSIVVCPYPIVMQTNPLITLSVQQLNKVVAIRERIDDLEKELGRITRGRTERMKSGVARKKRRLSAAAKARISTAMKARWAAKRAAEGNRTTPTDQNSPTPPTQSPDNRADGV